MSTPNSSHLPDDEEQDIQEGSKRRRTTSELLQESMVAASPPKFVSIEEIMNAAKGVTNMALAHEIALNEDFQLQKPQESRLQSQVKSIVQQAFWDVLKDDLKGDVKVYDRALTLLEELKESLLGLLMPHHTHTREQINDVMDLDLIRQQADKGTLDFLHYGRYIISVMAKLCAPVRDEKIRQLTAETDLVQMYKGIFDVLQLMHIDFANFTIQAFRPQIQQQSVEYEREKFKEFLKTQEDGLQYTREWLNRHKPTESSGISRELTNVILTKAYLELLEWPDATPFPETLVMDQHRFLELRDRAKILEVVAAVVLIVTASVQNQIAAAPEFRAKLKQNVTDVLGGACTDEGLAKILPNLSVKIVSDVNQELSQHNSSELSAEVQDLLRKGTEDLAKKENRIRTLIRNRIKEFLNSVLSNSSASPTKIPPGLNSVQSELTELTGKFTRLVSYNKSVFGDYYVEIIEQDGQLQITG